MSAPLLEVNDLACQRDDRLLFHSLDATFNAGDIVHIAGPNGCGKTTFLRTLATLFADFTGEILFKGESTQTNTYDFLSQLLFIGHAAGVKKTLSPLENLKFISQLQGKVNVDDIHHALAQVGLSGFEEVQGYQLSAGQQRRIGLARLYLSEQLIWLLDEPFTAIDVQGVAKLETLFQEHARKGGVVILTSHQQPQIPALKTLAINEFAPVDVDE